MMPGSDPQATLHPDDAVSELTEPFDPADHFVARLKITLRRHDVLPHRLLPAELGIGAPRGAAGRSGRDHDAGAQRHERREELDELRARPDHFRGAVALPRFAVDERSEVEPLRVGYLVASDE